MAARRAIAPRAVERTQTISVDDPQVDRALSALRDSIERLEAQRSRAVVEADLVVGTNKVRHGLGRAVKGYTLTPTDARADFAHAINRNNPRPDLEVWIEVIGVDQPGAVVEVY